MSIVEIIGFFISVVALILLFLRNWIELNRVKPLETGEEDFNEPVVPIKKEVPIKKSSYKASPKPKMGYPVKKKSVQSAVEQPPKFSRLEGYQFQTDLEKRHLQTRLEDHRLQAGLEKRHLSSSLRHRNENQEIYPKRKEPRISSVLHRLPHLRDLVIYHAILGKPKGLQ